MRSLQNTESSPDPASAIRETDGYALALAIAKLAGWRECPKVPNLVCMCAPGRCVREEAGQ